MSLPLGRPVPPARSSMLTGLVCTCTNCRCTRGWWVVGSRGSASIDATNGNTPPNNQGEAASFYPITGIPRKYLNSSRRTLST